MNEQEQAGYEQLIREAELRGNEEKVRNLQQESILMQQEKSMIQEQLDLTDELERIDYLLRGYVIEKNDDTGESKWVAPLDNDFIILSDYGVHLIRNTIAWYLNKNTLLSNYDEETINHKMEDFACDLTDTIFMEYEKVFKYPTFEDCKKAMGERILNKKNLRVYALEILGKEITEEKKAEIEQQILREIEPTLQKELEKLKIQIMKNKLKRFMILIREIQDAVHSTYLRALNGQERKTLREHAHISETRGSNPFSNPQQKSGFLDYFRKK